jgi:uncharacterized protein DUF6894
LPRYYFDLRFPDRVHDDSDGTDFPHDSAALDYAKRIIAELKAAGGYDDPGLVMLVRKDESGTVASIPC